MNSLRATLATTGMLLALAACTEQTVVPTEPSRDAPLTSIPGSSNVTVRTGLEAARYLEETAAAWSREGDDRLSRALMAQRELTVHPDGRADSQRRDKAPTRPSLALTTGDTPSPTTTPDAVIYYSTTVPYVNGSSATIVSSLTYFGNIAVSAVSYSAVDANGGAVIPANTVTNRGEGQNAPCIGSSWECSWTFTLQTVVSLNLGKDCGIKVRAGANHMAQWTTPAVYKLPAATWGTTYASDATASASNGACVPQKCLDASASNYGGPLPCTYATPTTGGDGSTTGTTGGTSTTPPTYEPGPFAPSGHWECIVYYKGTDYEREYCTWYADYTRVPNTSPAFALNASDPSARTLASTDLPSVFVIVTDQVPAGAMAVIERHSQGPFRNVLLLKSSTIRPAALVAALRALADSRARDGETPSKDLQLTLRGDILDQQIPAAARDYAASFASLIAAARRADAGAYGVRPLLELRLGDRK